MFDFNADMYLNKIAQSPKEHYDSLTQATLNSRWEDTTQIYKIKEQKALPFENEYVEYEAWISTVSDTLVNTSKNYSDFVRVLFKDVTHKQNYKGQYYKMSLENDMEETYICYDRMNKLTQVCEFKCVRCNNVLTWKDSNGNIITIPCYLGEDISSTNDLVSKSGITPNARMTILVQANEYTKTIVKNQRFMFEHSTAFKVEEVNNYMQEQGTNGEVTLIKIYINYSAILPNDNIALNVCDYYNNNNYSISINEQAVIQTKDSEGKLTATIKDNENVVDVPIAWKSANEKVVTIDDYGHYKLVGQVGESTSIFCYMKENNEVFDTVDVTIISSAEQKLKLIVSPNSLTELKQGRNIEFVCRVEKDGVEIPQPISYLTNWKDDKSYSIEETQNGFLLTNKRINQTPLQLTFYSEGCEEVVYNIKLIGIL